MVSGLMRAVVIRLRQQHLRGMITASTAAVFANVAI